MSRVRLLIAFVAGVAAVAVVLAFTLTPASSEPVSTNEFVYDPTITNHDKVFTPEREGLDGVLVYERFHQEAHTAGPSADVMRVSWTEPVLVEGVNVSVDVWPELHLVEFAVGRNWEQYGPDLLGGMIHTSSTVGGDIDETVWFAGSGFRVDPGEWVAVVAWLSNYTSQDHWVAPEVVLYFSPVDS